MGLVFAIAAGYLIHRHLTQSWVWTAVWLVPAYAALFLAVGAALLGGALRQAMLWRYRRILDLVPDIAILSSARWDKDDALFPAMSWGYEVSTAGRDGSPARLYRAHWYVLTPGLGWSGDDRFVTEVRRALRIHRASALALSLLIALPALALSIAAGVSDSWVWFMFAALLALPHIGVFLLPFPAWLHDALN